MPRVVTVGRDFDSWRNAARAILADGVAPADVLWEPEGQSLLEGLGHRVAETGPAAPHANVSKDFLRLAELVACHRDPERWPLLYRVLWRLTHGERELLSISVDDDVHRLLAMERQVRFDRHKMTAFVRFREIDAPDGDAAGPPRYVAWYRPGHYVTRLTAPFFANRFATMHWSILTPDDCAHWDGHEVTFIPGVAKQPRTADDVEDLWRTYYAHTFNPARVRVRAMKKEMPVRFWDNLPEAALIPDLVRDAPRRVKLMVDHPPVDCPGAGRFLPETRTLDALRDAARTCRGCDLCGPATQTVFGEGPATAIAMLIGEQPGDHEDLAGRPFVGPAGELLDRMLREAGIDRAAAYVTNAVKHFKFEPRGRRRVHAKPSAREVAACAPWLDAEIALVRPRAILCLGVTPAHALLGRDFRMTQHRGRIFDQTRHAPRVMATWHPSALLRIPDANLRLRASAELLDDLKTFKGLIAT